jgi:CHAD domain-containing protein
MTFAEKHTQTLSTACTLIRKQTDKLAEHLAELGKTENIESLHQTRVVCRRLHEALVFFTDCFDPAYVEGWKKTTKKLLRQLSMPRDLDVQVEFLEQFIAGLDSEHRAVRPGIERLLLRQKQCRQKLQKQVVAAAKRFQKKHVLINIRLQIDKSLYLSEIYPPPESREELLDRLIRYVSPRLKDVQERQSCIDHPQDAEKHHRLRIAIKKLRYTVEIGNAILSDALTDYIESLKEAQTILGELHDCNVWIETIRHFEEEEKQRMLDYAGHTRAFGRLRPGLEYFRQNRMELRQKRYDQAVTLIRRQNDDQFLPRLIKTIEQQGSV